MTTCQDLINQVRGDLLSGVSEQRNRLAQPYTAGGASLTLEFATTGIGVGTRLSVGQTVFTVVDVNTPAKVVSVIAGEDGSPDVNASTGAGVRVNPRFPDYRVFREINNELRALAPRLFQMKTFETTYSTALDGYDIPVTDLLLEYRVRYRTPSTRKEWPYLPRINWRLERNADLTDFPSGQCLHLLGVGLHSGFPMQLLYKAAFTPFAAVTDNVTVTGLPASAEDLLTIGAFIRMAATREIKRNLTESQPDPRRYEEVPSGGMLRAYQGAVELQRQRINEEIDKLRRAYPEVS